MKILIADDHELIRQGLRKTLEARPDWQVVAEAATGRQAVTFAEQFQPEVVVLDVSMPELNGLEAARQIRKVSPKSEVLVVTMHESEGLVRELIAAGARGYILKTDTTRLLVTAVEALAQHKPFFTGRISEMVLTGRAPEPGETVHHRLTAREREIVQMLAEGRSNKEIATQLGVSIKTIDAHRANIMNKLGLHSVTELVRYAIREKIIQA